MSTVARLSIASFIPAGTNILFELGLAEYVHGVTFECYYPVEAKEKPKVVSCIFDPNQLTSKEIDDFISQCSKDGTPMYHIHEDILKEKQVSVVLMQDLCNVCAIGPKLVAEAIQRHSQHNPDVKIVMLKAASLEGMYADVLAIAEACGVLERGHAYVATLKARVHAVTTALIGCQPVKCICMEWLDPIYNAGHWMPELVQLAGGIDPLAAAPQGYSVVVEWQKVVDAEAEALILMPCGFSLERSLREGRTTLIGKPGWDTLPAVKTGNVWAVNGNRLFSGSSPGLVEGLEVLASILHPTRYQLQAKNRKDTMGYNGDGTIMGDFANFFDATLPSGMENSSSKVITASIAIASDTMTLLTEAIAHFVPASDVSHVVFSPTTGGVNNVVYYVRLRGTWMGVLRIYNNGNDDQKVAYEHAVLTQLHKETLSFSIPVAMPLVSPTLSVTTTSTSWNTRPYVKLSTGASAAMFRPIQGRLPGNTCAYEIGLASGELSAALGRVDATQIPPHSPNYPYYDLYKVHHAVTRDSFFSTMQSSAMDPWRVWADKICIDITEMEGRISLWNNSSTTSSLPKQLIHGDMHYDNVLVDDVLVEQKEGRGVGNSVVPLSCSSISPLTSSSIKVTGMLDFEFVAWDWRAMEISICLSKYAGESDPMVSFIPFITGYAIHGILTPDEIQAVPSLIILRILSNVIYFVGRSLAKEDELSTLTKRIEIYCHRIQWITTHHDEIVQLLQSKFHTN